MSNGVLEMDDSERAWIQREFDDIKNRLDNKPCTAHGEGLAALKQHNINGAKSEEKKRDWFKISISIGMLILGAAMAFLAYGTFLLDKG